MPVNDIHLENKVPIFIYGTIEGGYNQVRVSVTKSQENPPQYPPRDPNIYVRHAKVYFGKKNENFVRLRLKWNPDYKTFQFILPDSVFTFETNEYYSLKVIVQEDTFSAVTLLPPSPELIPIDSTLIIPENYFDLNYSYKFYVHWRYPVQDGLLIYEYPANVYRFNYMSFTGIAQGTKSELYIYREVQKNGRISIYLYRYNEDYLKFAKSMAKYEDDITTAIYSNVQGAYGVFYAFYTDTMSIPFRIE